MGRALWKAFVVLVMVCVGTIVRYRHGDAIHDWIHNFILNRALGTSGVDYANHNDAQKFDFRYDSSGQMVRVGKKIEHFDAASSITTTDSLPARGDELGAGWSSLAVSGARKTERKELRATDNSSARFAPADGVLSASTTQKKQAPHIHPTGAEIHYSPFEKSKRSNSRSSGTSDR